METVLLPMNLRRAYLSMHRQTNAHLAAYKVTADQFVCLLILAEEDGIIQKELVKRANSDPNTMRAMLVLLEKRGLISREPHPNDSRARQVHLTEKGRELFSHLEEAVLPVHNTFEKRFTKEEAKTLNLLLDRITTIMAKK